MYFFISDNERNERREGGWKDNRREDDGEDRTLGDWRRRAPEDSKLLKIKFSLIHTLVN